MVRAAHLTIGDDHAVGVYSPTTATALICAGRVTFRVVIGAALVIATGCGAGAVSTTGGTTARLPIHPAASVRHARRHAADPGALPQTDAEPSSGAPLVARMRILWTAITHGAPSIAAPVFFPEGAYRQVKAIWNPSGDFRNRIWAIFTHDVAAYRRELGPHAVSARLTGVVSAPSAAGWVPRGVCENAVGYWHLPGTRLVYVVGTTRYSVGVDSMISWRGAWYVIHLGPNTTPTSPGTVDDPQVGPGTPGHGAGC